MVPAPGGAAPAPPGAGPPGRPQRPASARGVREPSLPPQGCADVVPPATSSAVGHFRRHLVESVIAPGSAAECNGARCAVGAAHHAASAVAAARAPLPRFQEELLGLLRSEFRSEAARLRQDIQKTMREVKAEMLTELNVVMQQTPANSASKLFQAVWEVLAAIRGGKMEVDHSEVLSAIQAKQPDLSEVLAELHRVRALADPTELLAEVRRVKAGVDLSKAQLPEVLKAVKESKVDPASICAELRKSKHQADFSVVLRAMREMDNLGLARAGSALPSPSAPGSPRNAAEFDANTLVKEQAARVAVAAASRADVDLDPVLQEMRKDKKEVLESLQSIKRIVAARGYVEGFGDSVETKLKEVSTPALSATLDLALGAATVAAEPPPPIAVPSVRFAPCVGAAAEEHAPCERRVAAGSQRPPPLRSEAAFFTRGRSGLATGT